MQEATNHRGLVALSNFGIVNGIEESLFAPADKVLDAVKIQVRIEPPSGAVLIYGGPDYDDPLLVEGPEQVVEISTTTPAVIVQKLRGAETYEIKTLGYLPQRPTDV